MVIHLCASSKNALPAIRKAKRIKCNSSIQSTASWQFLHFMTTLRHRRDRNCVDGWWRPARATLAQLMVDRGKSHTDLLQNNVAINSGWACHLDWSEKIMTSSPHPNSLEHCMADILCTYFGRGSFEFARSVCTEYQVFRRSWIHFTKFDSTWSRWAEMGKKMMPNATSRSPTSKRRSLLKSFVSSRETFTRWRDSNFLPSPTVHGATKQRDILRLCGLSQVLP